MELTDFLAHVDSGAVIRGGSEHHAFMHAASQEALTTLAELNGTYRTPEEVRALLSRLTGRDVDESVALFPPFYSEFGKNLTLGKDVFINMGCRFQDTGGITIGDGALIGHGCTLTTLDHSMDPAHRADMVPSPVVIGRKAWLGASVTVVPGVTIGDGAVVGAGAVVTKDVPANTIVAGVPARVIRKTGYDVAPTGRLSRPTLRSVHRIFTTPVASVYPHYVAKVERKGRTQAELDEVIGWLTGFDAAALAAHLEAGTTFADFFDDATLNPAAGLITGVVCGVRVEDVEDPLMQKVRYLDKLVDELARGKAMEKVLRS